MADDQGEFGLDIATEPMEARSAAALPDEPGIWQFEPKWDGFRCLAFKAGDDVDIRAKSGKPLGRFFPEIVALIRELPVERFVVDGELVIADGEALSFDALQARLHPAESRIRKLSVETPATFILFDILVAPDGDVVVEAPLKERRARLESLFADFRGRDQVRLSPATDDRGLAEQWVSEAGGGRTDGVVAKRLDGPYEPGERAMVKVKRLRTADCVVGGFRYESDSPLVGSLLLGLYDAEGRLNHVGYTSTITDAERPELTKRVEALRGPPGFTGKAPEARAAGAPNGRRNGSRSGRNWSSRSATITSPATGFATGRS